MKKNTLCFALALSLALSSSVYADDRARAKRIHERLTGVPPSNEMLDSMEREVGLGNVITAAQYAMDGALVDGVPASGHFYNVVVKNWASPWTNEAQDVAVSLNDYTATVVGLVRDSDTAGPEGFKKVLYDNVVYKGNTGVVAGLNTAYSTENNNHYEQLEQLAVNLGDSTVLVRDVQSSVALPASATAGVMTTRAAASAFFIDGTNRAMLRFTLLNHLCFDLEQLKDNSRPADRVRQDVSRSPGLDSTLFLNQCVACHAGMDPLAQAFAYYEYYPSMADRPDLTEEQRRQNGHLVYTPGSVQAKYHINDQSFEPGYITPNDHWTNYWRLGDNSAKLGWLNAAANSSSLDMALNPAYSEGDGAKSLGVELANSQAFAVCQVKKVYRSVCHREPQESDRTAFDSLVSAFLADFNIKLTFARAAESCTSHL